MGLSTRVPTIEPGRSYRQRSSGMVISTARVVSIERNARGIPHVHFQLSMTLPSGAATRDDHRILALERFADLFPVAL